MVTAGGGVGGRDDPRVWLRQQSPRPRHRPRHKGSRRGHGGRGGGQGEI